MSFFLDFVTFVLNGTSSSGATAESIAWGAVGLVFAFIGASFISSALWPQFKATYKFKNTVGLNVPMFSFHTLVAFLFLLGSIFMIPAVWPFKDKDYCMTVAVGCIFTALNVFGFAGNYYVISLKFKNMRESKKLGISEGEYYEKFVAPTLKTKEQ